MRLASATISSERLFSRLEGLSAIARVEPGAKMAALQPFPTWLTSMRCPLYSIAVTAYLGSLHFNLKRAARLRRAAQMKASGEARIFAISVPDTRAKMASARASYPQFVTMIAIDL